MKEELKVSADLGSIVNTSIDNIQYVLCIVILFQKIFSLHVFCIVYWQYKSSQVLCISNDNTFFTEYCVLVLQYNFKSILPKSWK